MAFEIKEGHGILCEVSQQRPNKGIGSLFRALYITNIEKHSCPLYPKANLDLILYNTYSTPSVFHADKHGMRTLQIWTLGTELQGHPQPHREPQYQQGQGLILEHISWKRYCLSL